MKTLHSSWYGYREAEKTERIEQDFCYPTFPKKEPAALCSVSFSFNKYYSQPVVE
jgi:hypothetical protein